MRRRAPLLVVFLVAAASCAPGSASPPSLAYGLPNPTAATYDVGDTITVQVSALGQSLSLGVDMTAVYGLDFERADGNGVRVTLGVDDLAARVRAPLAEPIQLDESIVSGNLVFSLSRRGEVTVISTPELAAAGGQLISPIGVAHSLFPRLPGIAVSAGDRWVDTLSYDDEASGASANSILEYTVVGDTVLDGLSLLAIDFTGTSETSQKTTLQGAAVSQSSQVNEQGRLLWDASRGLLFQREATTSGTGEVKVAAVPAPLPTTIESHSVARLRVE